MMDDVELDYTFSINVCIIVLPLLIDVLVHCIVFHLSPIQFHVHAACKLSQ